MEVGEYVRLTIEDSGTGMSADVSRHAFEPFFSKQHGLVASSRD